LSLSLFKNKSFLTFNFLRSHSRSLSIVSLSTSF
jgi:hypothetical protein